MSMRVDTEKPGFWVADVSWPVVEERMAKGTIALLFVGAASKEHGRHLPMGTDYFLAQWLGEALIDNLDVAIWPTLTYGYYPAFTEYPGSCSLPNSLFVSLTKQVLDDISRSGACQTFVINTGISTIKGLEEAIRQSSNASAQALHLFKREAYEDIAKELEEQKYGSHADELETSKMLVVSPDKVQMDKAKPCDSKRFPPGRFSRNDKNSPNYSPDGVYGDPTLATAEKGRRVLEVIASDLLKAINA